MSMLKEFREFAIKGNVVDLAIAVVIGAAFGKIIAAFTDSMLMPLISMVLGKSSVAELTFTVNHTIFPVGIFLQAVIDFILIAFVLFLVVKGINSMQKKKEEVAAAPAPPSEEIILLREIRDSLKK
jgi:large conductance mechanosensitive channel